jgi:hypothetical protein
LTLWGIVCRSVAQNVHLNSGCNNKMWKKSRVVNTLWRCCTFLFLPLSLTPPSISSALFTLGSLSEPGESAVTPHSVMLFVFRWLFQYHHLRMIFISTDTADCWEYETMAASYSKCPYEFIKRTRFPVQTQSCTTARVWKNIEGQKYFIYNIILFINWVVRALNADWLKAVVYQTVYCTMGMTKHLFLLF